MLPRIFFVFTIASSLSGAQNHYKEMIYFPEETITGNRASIPANINLTEIRGTLMYDKYVEQIISQSIAKLTIAINKVLLQKRGGLTDNIVFAPMSIGGALAMIHLGANGKTYKEITDLLGFASGLDIQSRSVQLHEQFGRMIRKIETTAGAELVSQFSFAQAIFVQDNYPIRQAYKDTLKQLYESETLHVDFEGKPAETQKTINQWVSDRTKGKIKNILAETPTGATKVIVATAMYFKALWASPFFEGTTSRRPFYSNGRRQPSTSEVDMMANGGEFPYYKDLSLQCEILGFPYKGNATVMYVVMPFNSDTEKLKQFENIITAGNLEQLADSTRYTGAVVLFPKMKIESTLDLQGPLRTLGLKSLFNPAEANLALMSPGYNNAVLPNARPSASVPEEQNYPTESPSLGLGGNRVSTPQSIPQTSRQNSNEELFIFSRIGQFPNPDNEYSTRKINFASRINTESLDQLRQSINQQSTDNNYQNPGLYANKIIHKVYMDITETGTEAAASTSVSLSRDGNRVTFRVDVPFLFFIRHEDTKTILFWGSVNTPSPYY